MRQKGYVRIAMILLAAALVLYMVTRMTRETYKTGKVVKGREYPWHANLSPSASAAAAGKSMCGGSVVTSDTVVTAAHCIKSKPTHVWVIDKNGTRQIRKIRFSKVHPKYRAQHTGTPSMGMYDLAVLKLQKSFGKGVSKISLGPRKKRKYGSDIHIIGRAGTTTLDRQTIYEVPPNKCKFIDDNKKLNRQLAKRVICTRSSANKTYKGDSGGPAYISKNGTPRLIGVSSSSHKNKKDDGYYYGLFTDLRRKENRKFVRDTRTKLFGIF